MKYTQGFLAIISVFCFLRYGLKALVAFFAIDSILVKLIILCVFILPALLGMALASDTPRAFTANKDGIREAPFLREKVYLPWDEVRDVGIGMDTKVFGRFITAYLYFSDRELTDAERLKIKDRRLAQRGRIIRIQYVRNKKTRALFDHLAQCCPGPLPEALFTRENPLVLSYVLREKNEAGQWEYRTGVTPTPEKYRYALERFPK